MPDRCRAPTIKITRRFGSSHRSSHVAISTTDRLPSHPAREQGSGRPPCPLRDAEPAGKWPSRITSLIRAVSGQMRATAVT